MSADAYPYLVATSNLEQAKAWDGEEGAYWAEHADLFERGLAAYDSALIEAAGISPASRVLDIGCGTGSTSRQAARLATEGEVLGVDLSSRMLEVARERAARDGLPHVRFLQADAQVHDFGPSSYDVVLGKTAAMFFGDKPAAFANLHRALAPGGRLAQLVWAPLADNEWLRVISTALTGGRGLPSPPPEAPSPFALDDPDRVSSLLTGAGFAPPRIDALREPMWLGRDAAEAHRFIVGLSGWMMEGLDGQARRQALDELFHAMAAHETPGGVLFGSAMWLVTAQPA